MQPLTEGPQRCLKFDLNLKPAALATAYRDHLGNAVHHFDIPVSGYLFHRVEYNDRSAQDATHAWVEALLPELGWVGFDPTNNLLAGRRHVRVAVGRDYLDVPPTRGVFKGTAESELSVAVQVKPAEEPDSEEALRLIAALNRPPEAEQSAQQQQQQQ